MGNPFKTKYREHVNVSVSRVVQDRNVVDTTKAALVGALVGDNDVIDAVLENTLSSIANTTNAYYRYGRDKYVHGLPSGEVFFNNRGLTEIQALLNSQEGEPVLLSFNYFTPINALHYGWMKLINDHAYNVNTNELGNLSVANGRKVYLTGLVLELPLGTDINDYEVETLEMWQLPPHAGKVPNTLGFEGLLSSDFNKATPRFVFGITAPRLCVEYTEVLPAINRFSSPEPQKGLFYLPITVWGNDSYYYHVRYTVGGQVKYWMYEYGSGVYPQLDFLYENGTGNNDVFGEFYPNIYYRLNSQKLNVDKTSAFYKTSKKLSKYLNIDYDTVADAVHQNEGITDVQSALLTFAVPADTQDPDELKYLYAFFDRMHNGRQVTVRTNYADVIKGYLNIWGSGTQAGFNLFNGRSSSARNAINIKDSAFSMVLNYSNIEKTRKIGRIADVGEVRMTSGVDTYNRSYEVNEFEGSPYTATQSWSEPYRIYQKQITNNFYFEIKVVGLSMTYAINGRNDTTLLDDADVTLVPLDKTIVDTITFRSRERLITRSMHMVFTSYVVQKVKWYQSGFFADLIQVIGIILTIYSLGTDGGFFASLGAAAAAGIVALATFIAMNIVFPILIKQLLFTVFIKVVGKDIAFLAALIAAVYGMAQYLKATTEAMIVTAKDFLQLSTGLAQGISRSILEDFQLLYKEMEEFEGYKKEKIDELEKLQDLFGTTPLLSPLFIPGETSRQYYQRTVHSGNIGTLLLDDVHYFVERSLQLPTFASSVEGYSYV
jgi:hypothetical protein